MSSLSEIYFNYEKAIKQARELENIAQRLQRAGESDLESILQDVNKAWKSDSSQKYIRKGKTVETDIHTTAKNLKQIASAIRSIAQTVREAELETWRIANERV